MSLREGVGRGVGEGRDPRSLALPHNIKEAT